MTAVIDQPGVAARSESSGWLCVVFVSAMCGLAWAGQSLELAIYSLSFWHYYLYWLAYRFGSVPLPAFKRDAILMKSVALLLLGYVYVRAPFNPVSLAVVAAGFALNALAARVLGSDRTYYGHEVVNLPPLHVKQFPYSWLAHPMLVGNVAAYGGTLLNAEFRRQWWPLACIHMGMNLGLLLMEVAVKPLRLNAATRDRLQRCRSRSEIFLSRTLTAIACLAVFALLGTWIAWKLNVLWSLAAGACICGFALALYSGYTAARS